MAWTRKYGVVDYTVVDPTTGLAGVPVHTASTSTVVLEDESELGVELVDPPEGSGTGTGRGPTSTEGDPGGWYRDPHLPSNLRRLAPSPRRAPPLPPGLGALQADVTTKATAPSVDIRQEPGVSTSDATVRDAARPGGSSMGELDIEAADAAGPEGLPAPEDDADPAALRTHTKPTDATGTLSFARLRMFGVGAGQLPAGSSVRVDNPHSLGVFTGAFGPSYHISYIESDDHGQFNLYAGDRIWNTWVPSAKVVTDWSVEVIASMEAPVAVAEEVVEEMVVLYRDPFVVEVPREAGGGWLMLLSRVRFRTVDLGPTDDKIQSARDEEQKGPGACIADIVAWHCTSQTFREGTLSGPFLVVDSLTAIRTVGLADDEVAFRTWLGAPTAIFCGEGDDYKLYVYFNVNRAYRQEADPDDPERTRSYLFDDPSTLEGTVNAYEGAEYSTGETRFRKGVGVHAVDIGTVRSAISRGISYAEDPWQHTEAWPGAIREPVRGYIEESRGGGNYRPLREAIGDAVEQADLRGSLGVAFNNRDTVHPGAADPAAVWTYDAPSFFVTIGPTDPSEEPESSRGSLNGELSWSGDTMLGLWRFGYLETGTGLSDGTTALFGRDLHARFGTGTTLGQSPDQITRTYLTFSSMVVADYDADPIWLESLRTVRVYSRERRSNDELEFDEFLEFVE